MSTERDRSPQSARAVGRIGTLLLLVGVGMLLVAGALQLYTLYAQMRWERAQAALSAQFLSVPTQVEETATPSATASAVRTAPPLSTSATAITTSAGLILTTTVTPAPSATPVPVATRTPTPPPPIPSDPGLLLVPKLKLSAQIVTVPLRNGQWNVDKLVYEVGWMEGTAFPGQSGNAAISGHVSLIKFGNGPFRWLEKLAANDEIIVQQGDVRYSFHVDSLRVVLPDDVSVLAQTAEPTLTLITCTGWDVFKADYTKRLIVTATLVSQRTIVSPGQ